MLTAIQGNTMKIQPYWVCRNTQCSVWGRHTVPEAESLNHRCARCLGCLEPDSAPTMDTCPTAFLDRFAWHFAVSMTLALLAFNNYLRKLSLEQVLDQAPYSLLSLGFGSWGLKMMYTETKRDFRRHVLSEPAPRFERNDAACKGFVLTYGIMFFVGVLQPLWLR